MKKVFKVMVLGNTDMVCETLEKANYWADYSNKAGFEHYYVVEGEVAETYEEAVKALVAGDYFKRSVEELVEAYRRDYEEIEVKLFNTKKTFEEFLIKKAAR